VKAIFSDPKQFGENLIDLQELKKDPAHWLGELIPNVALLFVGGGAGLAAKGADGGEAIDATTEAADAAQAADAARAGRVFTGFTTSRELLDMDPAEKAQYFGQVVRDINYMAPRITERPVDGVKVTFGVHDGKAPDFSWNPPQLDHVLTPDSPGTGGHSYATFNRVPGRIHTEYPAGWYPQKIAANSYKVLQDPDSDWTLDSAHRHVGPGYNVTGTVDGVKLQVTVEPYGRGIVTAFPVN
jgi:hypothetical protein